MGARVPVSASPVPVTYKEQSWTGVTAAGEVTTRVHGSRRCQNKLSLRPCAERLQPVAMTAPVSVIIPCLNAGLHLPCCLAALGAQAGDPLIGEIIVSDGGSEDDTMAVARAACAVIVNASRGRAKQLIAGAAAARGDWLLFLHADTALGAGWREAVASHIAAGEHTAGVFRLAYDADHDQARWLAARANRRTRWFGLPYGDQGLLISRRLHDRLGGFPDQPLMEDVEIVRRIGRSRLTVLDAEAVTSAEKYERDGYRRRAYRNGWLTFRYLLGATPEKLARHYD